MKLQTIISTALLAAIAALSINVQAGQTNYLKPVAKAKPETVTQTNAPMDEAVAPMSEASAPVAKKNPAQDRSKHFHPRDGK